MIHFIPKEQKTFCLIFPQFYIQFILQSMSCRVVDGALKMQFDLKGSKHEVRDEYQVSYTFTQQRCVSDFVVHNMVVACSEMNLALAAARSGIQGMHKR